LKKVGHNRPLKGKKWVWGVVISWKSEATVKTEDEGSACENTACRKDGQAMGTRLNEQCCTPHPAYSFHQKGVHQLSKEPATGVRGRAGARRTRTLKEGPREKKILKIGRHGVTGGLYIGSTNEGMKKDEVSGKGGGRVPMDRQKKWRSRAVFTEKKRAPGH